MNSRGCIQFSDDIVGQSGDIRLFRGDPGFLEQFEIEGYFNLRSASGELLPMFRVGSPPEGEEHYIGRFRVIPARSPEGRRKPRSTPPLVDFFMEVDRFLHFPDLPSRNYSSMANLLGYQPQYLSGERKRLYLILPGVGSQVALSDVDDFVVPSAQEAMRYLQTRTCCAKEIARYPNCLTDLFNSTDPGSGKGALLTRDLFLELLTVVRETRKAWANPESATGIPLSVGYLLRYWDDCILASLKGVVARRKPVEVLVQGGYRMVDLTEYIH